jgi:hypothetical protein
VTSYLPDILTFLIAAAGWFYLFNAHGAGRLVAMENTHMNARRIALRKAGGGALFALAVAFFCGLHLPDPAHHAVLFLLIWLAVFLLVGCIMILAFIDLRMTRRLHAAKSQKPS